VLLAGQGEWEQRLREQTARLGLAEQVRFLGVRRDREALYGALDLFALPSRWEGLSLALVEAAGAGLPIVATDVGGNAEVVGQATGAWLVAPEDPEALAGALSAAAALAGHVARFERPEIRARFGLAEHLRRLEASYRAVLGEAPEAAVDERVSEPGANGSGPEREPVSRPASRVSGGDDA
jgi:glycosyltransferase involved in cell wall biosynthesis